LDGAVELFRGAAPISAAIPRRGSEVEALEFDPDGTRLVIGAADGSVLLWSANETRVMEPFGAPILSAAFSSDGRFFAAGASDGTVKLWSLVGRDWSRRSFESSGGRIQSVAFGPKSDILAAACADGSIQVWSVFTGDQVGMTLHGHRSRMRSVSFMPDGRIISGQDDGSVRLWTLGATAVIPDADLSADDHLARLRSRVCGIANRNLSLAEWMQYIGSDAPYERECSQLPYGIGAGPAPAGAH
jgi:WD40 repeat protein